jgi:hypothetical protein
MPLLQMPPTEANSEKYLKVARDKSTELPASDISLFGNAPHDSAGGKRIEKFDGPEESTHDDTCQM